MLFRFLNTVMSFSVQLVCEFDQLSRWNILKVTISNKTVNGRKCEVLMSVFVRNLSNCRAHILVRLGFIRWVEKGGRLKVAAAAKSRIAPRIAPRHRRRFDSSFVRSGGSFYFDQEHWRLTLNTTVVCEGLLSWRSCDISKSVHLSTPKK